jgi:cytochrome c oxidase cbb3-type subunit 3
MRIPSHAPLLCAIALFCLSGFAGQLHQPAGGSQEPVEDAALVAKGKALFQSSCGFCHGNDATGSRAPDLVRSAILSHDENGSLLAPVIRNGRVDKGMPAFTTFKEDQISAIVAFLHHRATEALRSGHVASDYPLAKLLTGNAQQGKDFFNHAGGCSGCHSASGDLAKIAKKYTPLDLQQYMIYPPAKKVKVSATITTNSGETFEGTIVHEDEFNIGVTCQDGWYRSWPRDQVKMEVHDPLAAHRELTAKYSDADMHNLFAYLETLK